jgi:hypothetical protein
MDKGEKQARYIVATEHFAANLRISSNILQKLTEGFMIDGILEVHIIRFFMFLRIFVDLWCNENYSPPRTTLLLQLG